MCSSTEIPIFMSFPSFYQWLVVHVDVKNAVLRTGLASHDIFVTSPLEIYKRIRIRLLVSITYILVGTDAKWEVQ